MSDSRITGRAAQAAAGIVVSTVFAWLAVRNVRLDQVTTTLSHARWRWLVPATALLNDAKGLRVALVDDGDTLRLVPVVVERDTGATVQISSGLTADARVVKLSSADMVDGKRVEVCK